MAQALGPAHRLGLRKPIAGKRLGYDLLAPPYIDSARKCRPHRTSDTPHKLSVARGVQFLGPKGAVPQGRRRGRL